MARKGEKERERERERHAHTVLVEDLNEKGHFKVADLRQLDLKAIKCNGADWMHLA